jgi:hypothetical protein
MILFQNQHQWITHLFVHITFRKLSCIGRTCQHTVSQNQQQVMETVFSMPFPLHYMEPSNTQQKCAYAHVYRCACIRKCTKTVQMPTTSSFCPRHLRTPQWTVHDQQRTHQFGQCLQQPMHLVYQLRPSTHHLMAIKTYLLRYSTQFSILAPYGSQAPILT